MVGRFYVVVDEQIGSAAAAGTVEFRPAVRAFVPGVDIEPGKFFGDLQIESLIVNIAHAVLLLAHELVAGIDIALRRDGHVFAPGAAAADPLDNAGPLGQIDVEMEEIEIATVHHDLRQLFLEEPDALEKVMAYEKRHAGALQKELCEVLCVYWIDGRLSREGVIARTEAESGVPCRHLLEAYLDLLEELKLIEISA